MLFSVFQLLKMIRWNKKFCFSSDPNAVMTIEGRLGYRNKGDPDDRWTEYASSTEERILDCSISPEHRKAEYMYNCSSVPLFELGSLHHDFYLLNIRLPISTPEEPRDHPTNVYLGALTDMWVAVSIYSYFLFILSCFVTQKSSELVMERIFSQTLAILAVVICCACFRLYHWSF